MEQLFLYFTFVYDWAHVLQLLAVSFSVVFVLSPFSMGERGRGLLLFCAQVACVFAAETLLNWMLFYLSHFLSFLSGINFPLAHLVAIAVYAAFVSRYGVKSRIILAATVFVTAIATAELGTQMMRLLASAGGVSNVFAPAADVLIVLFAVLTHIYSVRAYDSIPAISVALALAAAVASAAVVVGVEIGAVRNALETSPSICLILFYVYLVTVVVYIVIYCHCTEHDKKVVLEVDKKLLEADIKMLSLSDRIAEGMKELRHDIKNQYLVMGVMLKEKRYDEAERYFRGMQDEFAAFPHFTDCGNAAVNSIMNMETLKAASKRVQILSKISVPAQLPVAVNDLCRIFVNLLDNALEAAEKTEGDRIVDLNVRVQNDYLYISVVNPLPAGADRTAALGLNTTKQDARAHGYGHKIVQKIVDKYNGYIHYAIEGNEFIAEALLDLKTESEHETN